MFIGQGLDFNKEMFSVCVCVCEFIDRSINRYYYDDDDDDDDEKNNHVKNSDISAAIRIPVCKDRLQPLGESEFATYHLVGRQTQTRTQTI